MLLSDTEITREIIEGGLVIQPFDPDQIQPASIDLHLGRELLIQGAYTLVRWDLVDNGSYRLEPFDFVLGATLEWFMIGPHLAGEIVGKSSRAREGLVIEAAGYFDPGWKGQGTLEMSCRSPRGVLLTAGMPICQLRLHPIAGQVSRPYGSPGLGSHYQDSEGPRPSFTQQPVRPVPAP